MKFYANLNDFDLKDYLNFEGEINQYTISHMYFYMCLLPKNFKNLILNQFEQRSLTSKSIFNRILNVEETFCDNIEECDYVVLKPNKFCKNSLTEYFFDLKNKNLIEKTLKNNKKILLFCGNDNNQKFDLSEQFGYIFRSSGFLSQHKNNVFGCPTFNIFVENNFYCKKHLSVSFCGWIESSCQGNFDDDCYSGIRKKIIYELSTKNYFNLISRDSWCSRNFLNENYTKFLKHREEYYDHIKNNLYGLCVRGGGNFSFRLAEVFMMARIPILIYTDCILPFRNQIPYETNTVYVTKENSNNFKDVDSVIRAYHDSHTEDELIKIQKENFKIWIEYFTPDYAFKNTCKLLKELDGK